MGRTRVGSARDRQRLNCDNDLDVRTTRVFVDHDLSPGAEIELDPRAARYLSQTLRLRAGQVVTLFNGDGNDMSARLTHCTRRSCGARVAQRLSSEPQPSLTIHLGIGISRSERMDFAIQKSVELGVTAITPLTTERSVVHLRAERIEQRMAHWRGIVISACEQSGRSRLPELHRPTTLQDWVARHPNGLMLYHRASTSLASLPAPTTDQVHLLIGPEGGLADHERDLASAAAYTGVRMGPRVLRTETAPIAALAAIQTLWGDFR